VKVLLVDDSERLCRSLAIGLRHEGFAVDAVHDGEAGLASARHGDYDVVVLDLMLPKLDGLTVLRRLRAAGGRAHVLVLSAKDRVDERVEGLGAGADDYLVKPFEFDELVARLRALVRRKFAAKDPVHEVGPVRVDTGRRLVERGGVSIEVTPHEYAILEYLLARRGRVVPKSELLGHLYTGDDRGSENGVEVFVHQLRRKLGDPTGTEVIRTRRGHGYVIE
jgi:DNA-binding response OmpR family regulator